MCPNLRAQIQGHNGDVILWIAAHSMTQGPNPNPFGVGHEIHLIPSHLDGSHARWQPQPGVVPMRHDDASNHAGAHAEAALVHVLQLAGFIQEPCIECLREVVPEIVAGPRLPRQGTSRVGKARDLGAGLGQNWVSQVW